MRPGRWLKPLEKIDRFMDFSVGLVCLFVSIGCSSQQSNLDAAKVDRIEVLKSKHQLVLFADGKSVKSYQVALGRSDGPKRRQGDHKTPEGQYVIDWTIAESRFHFALHVSYPNPADRKQAQDDGDDPGGDIEIHGVEEHFAWLGPLQHDWDWTDGCIAVTNREIEEIWRLVPVGTPVVIKP